MSEAEFERILCQHASVLAADCFLRPFKLTVRGAERDGRPDLILIDRDYRFWWVIEVERGDHDLVRHVLPQIQCFRSASYGYEVVEYLKRNNPDLDPLRLRDLMLGDPPEVAVVSDRWDDTWEREIRLEQARYLAVTIFRSAHNRLSFLREGFLPSHDGSYLTECLTTDWLAAMALTVRAPAALPVSKGEEIILVFRGSPSRWQRIDTQTNCVLLPRQRVDLSPQTTYRIERSTEGALHLVPRKKS